MTWEIVFVFAVILAALVLFAIERFPVDQIALAIPVVLLMAGILSAEEAISGFSNTATVTVAAMLVLSLGLVQTGAVDAIGRWAGRAPLGGPRIRLAILCVIAAAVSPFLNNTAVVVVFLPVFLAVCQKTGQPPSRALMPLSFAAILGGTITLIGTSTNLIVYGMAQERGFDELTMFSIAPLGLIYLAVGLLYLFTIGQALLPRRAGDADLSGKYDVRSFVTELQISPQSPATGRTLTDLRWGDEAGVSVLGLTRGGRTIWSPGPDRRLQAGDLLYAQGHHDDLLQLAERMSLSTPVDRVPDGPGLSAGDAHLAEVLVAPAASVVGRTLRETRFQQLYNVTVLAVQHLGRIQRARLANVRIETGDLLLVHGSAADLESLVDDPGFVPVSALPKSGGPRPRALVAIGILAAVVAVAGLEFVPILPAALTGVLLMIFTRCVTLEEIYEEMDWMVIFLLAGVIPLGIAMEETGAAQLLAHTLAEWVRPYGPTVAVAGFYLMTSLMTEMMSNNATAVVLTPIALLTSAELGMNPYALLVAVMFGASASFMTPVGYQTNALVYGPGGYRFSDFLKVGGPLNLLLLVTGSIFIPIFWPS
ncbi:MAG TPA: SLC13 family permease [Gemmatimonadota bacterium]|nr:SLC13 family permease [Gemmatimonadota bacterium]